MTLGQDVEQYLEKEIRSRGGFVGMLLDEDMVILLERKLREEGFGVEIFYLMAVDSSGHTTIIVPEKRADAKTFKRDAEAFDDVGNIQVEEVEDIVITRFKGPPSQHVVRQSQEPSEPGMPCIHKSHRISEKKEKKY